MDEGIEERKLRAAFERGDAAVMGSQLSFMMNETYDKFREIVLLGGGIKAVKFFLRLKLRERDKTDFCITYSRVAAREGELEVVNYLVQAIANQSDRDQCCIEAAKEAAIKGRLEVLTFLVPIVTDPTKRDQCCIEAAKEAAIKSHFEVVIFLVLKVADQTKRDRCCTEAAKEAVIKGHLEVVEFLLSAITDQSQRDLCCTKAAREAAMVGQLDAIKFLLPVISDQGIRDQCRMDAAKDASTKGQWEMVQFLVHEISEQSVMDDCCIQVSKEASMRAQWDMVKFLVQKVVDQSKRDLCRKGAAIEACSRLEEDVVAFLQVDPDWLFQSTGILNFFASRAIEGRNSALNQTLSRMEPAPITQLLCVSISQGHVSLALTLINDRRVSTEHVDLPDSNGATALILAADAGHHELIEKLLDLGASVRAQDNKGRTALSRAFAAGHVRTAKMLMNEGADENHKDGEGRTCAYLAKRREQWQVLRLLGYRRDRIREVPVRLEAPRGLNRPTDDPHRDRKLSQELHRQLNEAGFTTEKAKYQQRMANAMEEIARVLTQDDLHMTGSYAEGWANSLVQVNGRTAADSDIDWTVLLAEQTLHLEDSCTRMYNCKDATLLKVEEGHAQVSVGSGSQPAVATKACGVRPSQDTCYAIKCCSSFCRNRIEVLLGRNSEEIHLVRATRPNSTNEMRVSFSFQEKEIMRRLSTVQGQLFTLIKFIFKRLLPHAMDTPGLKTYHAKTLVFFMLERHGTDPSAEAWQPQNLIARLKESLDMMLDFINKSSSPDECMPHFFMPDAPLYFKNAGIGGDFDNTKASVRERLQELRSDICFVVEKLSSRIRPLKSSNFYFHPYTRLPLKVPPSVTEIRAGTEYPERYLKFADVYCVVHHCLSELQLESSNEDFIMRQLGLLHERNWCKCATLCMTAMAHLKFGEQEEAERLAMDLSKHRVEVGFRLHDTQLPDWAWRFCLPLDSPPRFPFLPEFTQTLFTARLSQPRSSHLYVNFRCLSWSLQAELLGRRTPIPFGAWLEELQEDPDLEELLTLAHYSNCREHVEFSLRHMETIRDEKRIAMETQDEEKIAWVREKLQRPDLKSSAQCSCM